MSEAKQSPLFARAYDLVKESCVQSERLPRARRAVLGRRMEESAFYFHDAIVEAAKSRDPRPQIIQAGLADEVESAASSEALA